MAYIVFVNPGMLSQTGMSWGGVFLATCLAAAVGTLIMALVANVPYAVAPGMGLNAIFTYTVCLGAGFSWQEALAMVFICGLINVIITVTKIRKSIIKSIPKDLQNAIGGGIGLFITYLGLNNAGLITFGATPAFSAFNTPAIWLSLIGLGIMVILMVMKVRSAILVGIAAATIIGIPMGVTKIPETLFSGAGTVTGFKDVSFAFFGAPGIGSLFSDPAKLPFVIITIFSMSLADTFDSIGTFIGTGRKSKIFDEEDEKALESGSGFKSRLDKALFGLHCDIDRSPLRNLERDYLRRKRRGNRGGRKVRPHEPRRRRALYPLHALRRSLRNGTRGRDGSRAHHRRYPDGRALRRDQVGRHRVRDPGVLHRRDHGADLRHNERHRRGLYHVLPGQDRNP